MSLLRMSPLLEAWSISAQRIPPTFPGGGSTGTVTRSGKGCPGSTLPGNGSTVFTPAGPGTGRKPSRTAIYRFTAAQGLNRDLPETPQSVKPFEYARAVEKSSVSFGRYAKASSTEGPVPPSKSSMPTSRNGWPATIRPSTHHFTCHSSTENLPTKASDWNNSTPPKTSTTFSAWKPSRPSAPMAVSECGECGSNPSRKSCRLIRSCVFPFINVFKWMERIGQPLFRATGGEESPGTAGQDAS